MQQGFLGDERIVTKKGKDFSLPLTVQMLSLPFYQKAAKMAHMNAEQRYTIEVMLANGHSRAEISRTIGRDRSVVSREIKRNSDGRNGAYRAALAQEKYTKRQKEKPKKVVFNDGMKAVVEGKLALKWSPEQISGAMKKDGRAMVGHETIYKYVWDDKKKGGNLYENLRTNGKRYRKRGGKKDKRGQIKNRVAIKERPNIVEERERLGDFEIDLIVGKDHKGAILTINDRCTGTLDMSKPDGKGAEAVADATFLLLKNKKYPLHTITSDNGKEFAMHEKISKELDINFYFAQPYHSWERGSNENLNGLVRQYIPKKTDFSTVTDGDIEHIQEQLNNRPRKRFGYLSPNQMTELKMKQSKDQPPVAFVS